MGDLEEEVNEMYEVYFQRLELTCFLCKKTLLSSLEQYEVKDKSFCPKCVQVVESRMRERWDGEGEEPQPIEPSANKLTLTEKMRCFYKSQDEDLKNNASYYCRAFFEQNLSMCS
jgi:hypothetical protein